MRGFLISVTAVALVGCASTPSASSGYTLTHAENDCAAQGAPFVLLSGCLQSHMQNYAPEWRLGVEADLLDVYFAWLSAAGDRVSRGELAENEGRAQASQLRSRLRAITTQRSAAVRQQGLSNALVGLAILNSATPQPGPVIQCHTTPTGLGTTLTTCR